MSLAEKLETLYQLRGRAARKIEGRTAYQKLLKQLDNPHHRLPPVIHVAGTNGKGSVIAILKAILQTAGYRVHSFTSPHLIKFNERITLAGQEISNSDLEQLLDQVKDTNELSFFEITTALAFKAFSQTPADIVLLETGIGGRLDCTNIIERPAATIITSISYDHTDILGETITAIAFEKAGIIKPDTACIIGKQSYPEVLTVLEARAKEISAPLYHAKKTGPEPISLTGQHQIDNAATALTTLDALSKSFPVEKNHIATGLQNIHWPGRLQKLSHPSGKEIWLDGGHNEGAAQSLTTQLQRWQAQDGKALHLMIGMVRDKDQDSFLKHLAPYAASINMITLERTGKISFDLSKALENIPQQDRVLITGSLYLAGHILSATT